MACSGFQGFFIQVILCDSHNERMPSLGHLPLRKLEKVDVTGSSVYAEMSVTHGI